VVLGPCSNDGNSRIVYIVAIHAMLNHRADNQMEQKTP
jgi:hypothetical protein